MKQSLQVINGKMRKLMDATENRLSSAYDHYALEILVFLVILFFSFYSSFVHKFPMGYSGLYSLMTERIIKNHYVPPQSIEFYGPGKIPFAYPPLGFYVNAILVTLSGIDQFTFLRFFAPSISIITAFVCYLLFRRITADRFTASVAVLLFMTTSEYIKFHVQSGGMVRGPALLFAILGIYSYHISLDRKASSIKHIFLPALLLGLSFLTHLSYGVFCIFSIFLLAAWGTQNLKQRVSEFALVAVIALIVSAPWWLLVVRKYGLSPFLGAINSHSTVPSLTLTSSAPTPGAASSDLMEKILSYPVFYVFGLPYWLMKRDWHKAVWGLSTGLFVGESARFMALFGSMALAELCFDLARYSIQAQENTKKSFLPAFLAVTLALLFVLIGRYDDLKSDKPFLTDEVMKVANWMKNNTEPSSKYLFISREMNGANEWMPYLARRTPVLGHWGAEWLGDYNKKHETMSRIIRCADKDSWECVQRVVKRYASRPNYIVFFRNEFEHLEADIGASGYWKIVFQDDTMIVYRDSR